QQVIALAHPGGEILLNLGSRERTTVNRGELDDTLPLPLAGDLVPEHERERAVPIAEGPSLAGIRIARVRAVHVDLLSVYGVAGQHDVLQGRLCEHAHRGGQQRRSAVVVRVAAACAS